MNRAWRYAVLLVLVLSLAACQMIKEKVGIHTTVSEPEKGSPERVIQDVLKAALEKDEERGWERYRRLLHSSQQHAGSLKHLRQNNYAALRRKVTNYLVDEKTVSYDIVRIEERSDERRIYYLHNSRGTEATPCTLEKDPKASDHWKVKRCSL